MIDRILDVLEKDFGTENPLECFGVRFSQVTNFWDREDNIWSS